MTDVSEPRQPDTVGGKGSGGGMERSTRYPRYSLREAVALAQASFDLGGRHVDQHAVASRLGFKGVENGAFKGRRAAARYFGLVEYSGDDHISVAPDWIRVFHEEDPSLLEDALGTAALVPELYRQLFERYKDKMLPRLERLARELYLDPALKIRKDVAEDAAKTFLDSMTFAGLVDGQGFLRSATVTTETGQTADTIADQVSISNEPSLVSGGSSVLGRGTGDQSEKVESGGRASVPGPSEDGYDRLEVRLPGGRKAFLLIPAPGTLSTADKQRLKGFIDLVLEDE